MAAPNYDEMADEAETEEVVEDAEEESALDDELMMHAEEAGFDEAKAKALKAFVERCVELRESGGYEPKEGLEELL